MKIRKFFCNAIVFKKRLECNDFNRLKKNKTSIFSVEIAEKLQKFETGTLPNMASSKPLDRVT